MNLQRKKRKLSKKLSLKLAVVAEGAEVEGKNDVQIVSKGVKLFVHLVVFIGKGINASIFSVLENIYI